MSNFIPSSRLQQLYPLADAIVFRRIRDTEGGREIMEKIPSAETRSRARPELPRRFGMSWLHGGSGD